MTCSRIRDEIAARGFRHGPGPAHEAHLVACELCRHWYEDFELRAALAAQPVPPPSPGFVDRALANAAQADAQGRVRLWTMGGAVAAAVLALAIGVAGVLRPGQESGQVFGPASTRLVNVVIEARDDRSQALVTVELTEELELEGYGDRRRIEWHTDLAKGRNLLALPVRVRSGAAGDLRIALSYEGGTRKEMHIPVRSG